MPPRRILHDPKAQRLFGAVLGFPSEEIFHGRVEIFEKKVFDIGFSVQIGKRLDRAVRLDILQPAFNMVVFDPLRKLNGIIPGRNFLQKHNSKKKYYCLSKHFIQQYYTS